MSKLPLSPKFILVFLVAVPVFLPFADAAVPETITIQGTLEDPSGGPMTGTYHYAVRIWDASVGGSLLRISEGLMTPSESGRFSLELDMEDVFVPPAQAWYDLAVDTDNDGIEEEEFFPDRVRFHSVPFARIAANAEQLGGQSASGFVQSGSLSVEVWSLTGNTTGAGNFLGTTNAQPLELRVNNLRGFTLIPHANSPNLVGGHAANTVGTTVEGGTIGGGGTSVAPNEVAGNYGTVSGGKSNCASGEYTTVGGGISNVATESFATVGGGDFNQSRSWATTVAGGSRNDANSADATVGGGSYNTANGYASVIAGGGGLFESGASGNTASGSWSVIGGGHGNVSSAISTTVSGGSNNSATETYATVGGGNFNTANGYASVVSGGGGVYAWGNAGNVASASWSTVGGGSQNAATNLWATVGGGDHNQAEGMSSTIAGGDHNLVEGRMATIGGGDQNVAQGSHATVTGGYRNHADEFFATVAGGLNNQALGAASAIAGGDSNYALGHCSAIPGGLTNEASGETSLAAGRRAKAIGDGSFVWGDSNNKDIYAWNDDEFVVRATGGFWFITAINENGVPTEGMRLPAGTSAWIPIGSPKAAAREDSASTIELLRNENVELKARVESLETRMASLESLTAGKAMEQ
ncbi:MAG: hypothetical protein H6752_14470 [Candidatus Omnitrophica bacterium]|nr:hypothetical protein [Candidatus Omnitrophota bacterium]